jgi:hypothetical protein
VAAVRASLGDVFMSLDYANRVNPEELYAEFSGDIDGVFESPW